MAPCAARRDRFLWWLALLYCSRLVAVYQTWIHEAATWPAGVDRIPGRESYGMHGTYGTDTGIVSTRAGAIVPGSHADVIRWLCFLWALRPLFRAWRSSPPRCPCMPAFHVSTAILAFHAHLWRTGAVLPLACYAVSAAGLAACYLAWAMRHHVHE